jgi:hypothetical protein
MTSEDGTHSDFRNVVNDFNLHTVQNSKTKESIFFPRWKSEIKNKYFACTYL